MTFPRPYEAVGKGGETMKKWAYPLLLLFVVFYVLSNPGDAGTQANTFFGWLGDQAGNAGTFLDGLSHDDDDNPDDSPDNGTSLTSVTTGVTPDSFDTIGPIIIIEPLTI